MPRTIEDVEAYLEELGRTFERADPDRAGTYLVSMGAETAPVYVRVDPPIVAFRVVLGPVPAETAHELALYKRLLAFNASDLMFASYGVDPATGTIVLTAALELENLDKNEVEAVLNDMDLALVRQLPELRALAK